MGILRKIDQICMCHFYRFTGLLFGWGVDSNGIWKGDVGYVYDRQFSEHLVRFFKSEECRSVVDVGCGLADYLKTLKCEGVDCLGFDANTGTAHRTTNISVIADVTLPLPSPPWDFRFPADWALCISVGEQIPRAREAQFLENLDMVQSRGLIVSWDSHWSRTPGGHNFKSEKELLHLFEHIMCYKLDQEATEELREAASLRTLSEGLYCFRKNTTPCDGVARKELEARKAKRIDEHFALTKML
eukprot:GHVS01096962.1.p1 GENE.GHVS01096962.1~~GHVS01096962.1.p1  ORF type:complete len:244 (+),score=17.78 GHVS01096962.1:2-733(+)